MEVGFQPETPRYLLGVGDVSGNHFNVYVGFALGSSKFF